MNHEWDGTGTGQKDCKTRPYCECNFPTQMDPTILYAATALAACHVLRKKREKKKKNAGGRPVGVNVNFRLRRSIESVYQELGDELFRRAYRMTYPTFLELHGLLEPEMMIIHKKYMDDLTFQRKQKRSQIRRRDRSNWTRFVPNGVIPTLTRLAIALRYFAGGSLYDLCPLFGVGRSDAFRSVWMVVEATHRTNLFNLVFPMDHDAKRELARQFSIRSQAGFDCCVGAVDGILIWILKPSPSCCINSKCDASKFLLLRRLQWLGNEAWSLVCFLKWVILVLFSHCE